MAQPTKKSGVDEAASPLPSGGGAIRTTGDVFQPNLAMGGGSYKVPLELPSGPGGYSPKIDLFYHTGLGNGPFGPGWRLGFPYVERRRRSPFVPRESDEYTLAGNEVLVPVGGDAFVSRVAPRLQRYVLRDGVWTSITADLTETRYGATSNSRVEGVSDGVERVQRWLLDRITFTGGRTVELSYATDGAQRYLARVRWSVFRLEFEYEDRPDPFSHFDAGFELRTARRCRRIALHHDDLGVETLIRTWTFAYETDPASGVSLLAEVQLSGWRHDGVTLRETALPALRLGYTRFSPAKRRIETFRGRVIPPPALGEDVTLVDLRGTSLPGVLQLDGTEGTYWENRGGLTWGPPERLRQIPLGARLSDPALRFADMDGTGTADLVDGDDPGYWPNDPEEGFLAKRSAPLTPSFGLSEPGSYLVDLDGDGVADLLVFRNGRPMAFFNERGGRWRGPVALPGDELPDLAREQPRLRFADMNGDGIPDLVLLYSRRIVYYPGLGNGRWGAPRVMAGTPEFDVPRPEEDVHLADVDGDGVADLVLVGNGVVRLHLNRGGEGFGPPIELRRTPRMGVQRFLLADMAGSGSVGMLWTMEAGGSEPTAYRFIDLAAGVKPYLLESIDNGAGQVTRIEYSTSAVERARDLADGRRWSGYLPFVVHVVKRMFTSDTVTGQTQVHEYDYHDGHYDGRNRELLGFATVDARVAATAHEAAVAQRYTFHNGTTTADEPAFVAGKGQPRRTELLDETGAVRRIDESTWEARAVAGTPAGSPAWLALETVRASSRLQDGTSYERERIAFTHDADGNIVRESRRGEWHDGTGPRVDELVIETDHAVHPVHGTTTFVARTRKRDGSGRLLKSISFYYDGEAFVGLPFGRVEHGFRTRQTEIALTQRELDEAYDGTAPPILSTLYREELDPQLGRVFVHDTRRYRVDAVGNQLETLDALGHRVRITYDALGLHPVSVQDGSAPAMPVELDPITQQVAMFTDLNGHAVRYEHDALGNVTAVYRRGALAGRPTESYVHDRSTVPHRVTTRVRLLPDDATPGHVKVEYRDGGARVFQTRILAEDGRWAVTKQKLESLQGRRIGEREAYFSTTDAFEPEPPPGTRTRALVHDFAGRVLEEGLFGGGSARYVYVGNETRFYGPDAAPALATDPSAPPSRITRTTAWGDAFELEEIDGTHRAVQRREHDALRRLTRIVDPLGHVAIANVYDLWGNRIRVDSADAGTTRFVLDGMNLEVQRIDADGRVVHRTYDERGRPTEVRHGGPAGAVQERFSYDAGPGDNLRGRLSRVEGTFGTVEYSYSVDGDPTTIRRTYAGDPRQWEVRFTYDHQRQVRSVGYPGGRTLAYGYHPNGKLASIEGVIQSIAYDAAGKRSVVTFANGLETRYERSGGDELLRRLVTRTLDGATRYQDLTFHLDAVGQVLAIEDDANVTGKIRNDQTFEYDRRHRLVHATGRGAGGDWDYRYEYDDVGNLLRFDESFDDRLEYGYHLGDLAAPHRLIKRRSAPGPEYEYDAAGNMTRDPAVGRLEYDARGRLVRVVRNDGGIVEHAYDHRGRRCTTRVTHGATTSLRIDVEGLHLVEEGRTVDVVHDDERRLALLPSSGEALLHHFDRLGNVNVVSSLRTGEFLGNNEYTPYGRLAVAITNGGLHFGFQGNRSGDGLDLVFMGTRWYRPALGRFVTPDRYLLAEQEELPLLLAGTGMYLYSLANPVNFVDPTGQIAFLAVLLVAVIVGAVLGAIGAGLNGAQTWDEWLLWIVGGAIGGALVALGGYGIAIWIFGASAAVAATAAAWVVGVWAVVSLLGSFLTPILDETNSEAAWFFSFMLKWFNSPITTTIGLFAALIVALAGGNVDLRRGMLFIEIGPGGSALTLGAVAWTQSGLFDAMGNVSDDLARHEAYHSRTVVALGELGFYVTYVTFGAIWGAAQGGAWNDLNGVGCGNPFEKTAHTFTGDPATTRPAHRC